MIKISYEVEDNLTELLTYLQQHFGYPSYKEKLVMYLETDKENVKVTITNSNFSIEYRDLQKKTSQKIHIDHGDIKETLKFLAKNYGNEAIITISPVYRYEDGSSLLEVVSNSWIGDILRIESESTGLEDNLDLDQFQFIGKIEKGTVTHDYSHTEPFINQQMSESGVLHSRILEFLENNGIPLGKGSGVTYKEMLDQKSNDFSRYEEIFELFTDTRLLSKKTASKSLDKMENVTISFIIPSYNSEETISKTLSSIQSQDISETVLNNTEVIIIDDASSEPVKDYVNADEYSFDVNILRTENNCGISTARNLGVTYAQGEILIFLDSDILLSRDYLREHIVRNLLIDDAVFVSFKENIDRNCDLAKISNIEKGLELPDYSKDLRVYKEIEEGAVGSYEVKQDTVVEILEDTNYFKSFHGSRVFGVYDLSCMVTGHNFSARKSTILNAEPFSQKFQGWGMEDVYLGLKVLATGKFIIPVLSCGTYHLDHPPRSGSKEKKMEEYQRNTEIINDILEQKIQK